MKNAALWLLVLFTACSSPITEDPPAVRYAITITPSANGTVTANRKEAPAGEVITLTITPKAEYVLASIRAGADGNIVLEGGGNTRTFTMPAGKVTITASFIADNSSRHEVSSVGIEQGSLVIEPEGPVRAGSAVTVTLRIDDPVNYRYEPDSLSVTMTDNDRPVHGEPSGDLRWIFIMPDAAVTISAVIEFIPRHAVTITAHAQNGSFVITGIETDGDYAGTAREGTTITITAIPDSGYKTEGGSLSVTPSDAVTLARLEDHSAWTFAMPAKDLELGIDMVFAALDTWEIYKGGARNGITVGALSDDPKLFAQSIDMESALPGHNDNRRSITVYHATGSGGGSAQQSFGLFSDTAIDLAEVTALSFWAKANKSLNIRYAGFGDADPDRRVVYTGEGFNQQIALTPEWKRYIIPVPSSLAGQTAFRVFFFNAQLAIGNYVCIDDIEFIQSGVTVTGITIATANNGLYYGATAVEKICRGTSVKLVYACDDGTTVTLQSAVSSHTLKHNLFPWLAPFATIRGNGTVSDGIIIPAGRTGVFTLIISMAGKTSNPMTLMVLDGLLLDDFEDGEGSGNSTIPGSPAGGTGYLWHTTSSGSVVVGRDYFTAEHNEIHSGLRAGSWRPSASANTPRGGRNFEAKDASGYNTLTFWIKVTTGGSVNLKTNTVFTFELRNGGTLDNKTNGTLYTLQFTYDPDATDGWQEVTLPLVDFIDAGLDVSAITGYALGVVDNQGADLRIMLDDIALIP
jgi:hypothetical protein